MAPSMKRVFSIPKLSALIGSQEEAESNTTPITDSIDKDNTNPRKGGRRKTKRSGQQKISKRNSHNDLLRLASDAVGKEKKKRSSHNDLTRLVSKGKGGSNGSLSSLWKSSGSASSKGSVSKLNYSKELVDGEVDDILKMVKQLKSSSHGQQLLSEFVDYQTGKTKRKPKLLRDGSSQDSWEDPSSLEFAPPLSEIYIEG
ncbi:expressed unknown protein [Seminavis robusta]|uniref:Uncharacterized protein n=1 Tax=Seminavis robusta TaxID=568900 RepID=A0A9N8DN06_9STRA|nr:expressed unknown protein [Seminavis robusta]|eukprot:Sro238_g095430.1 n/a (200) ;mRNA; r:9258-9857